MGDNASVESYKALGSYKKDNISSFFGVEQRVNKDYVDPKKKKVVAPGAEQPAPPADDKPKEPEVPTHFLVVGGFLKKHDNNKQFGANGSYNNTKGKLALEFLFRKNYEDGTFLKLKGDLEGVVGVSKQFKPQSGVTLTLGTNVNVHSGKGNAGFQFSTDL